MAKYDDCCTRDNEKKIKEKKKMIRLHSKETEMVRNSVALWDSSVLKIAWKRKRW
jgi:hypothetical protein